MPPAAFLQATAEGEAALARLVLDICSAAGAKKGAADLFAGVGPFALRLAERTRVTAADDDEAALAALVRAANAPGLKPVTTERRDLFKNPFLAAELNRFDAVVFDPPRQGAQMQSREIAASRVPIIAAVSCNPGTFARDMRILIDGGYRLAGVTPVDQFRYSAHVELVGAARKRLMFGEARANWLDAHGCAAISLAIICAVRRKASRKSASRAGVNRAVGTARLIAP